MIIKHIPRRLCTTLLMCAAALMYCASAQSQELSTAPAGGAVAERVSTRSNGRSAHTQPARSRNSRQREVRIRVRAGDTLSLIAARFGVPVDEVARLNGLTINDEAKPGQEILVPDPSVSSATASSSAAPSIKAPGLAANHQRDGLSRLSLLDGSTVEADEVWEDEQGVRYRRGGVTYLIERARVRAIERGIGVGQAESTGVAEAAKDAKQVAKLVEVGADVSQRTMQPVWIYLVGGARVEADDVTETPTGVWYKHGTLSIFLESSRIERIERETLEQVASEADAGRSWKERGWSTGNAKIDALIRQNGARYNVDPYLIFCVMEQESHFNARVVSPKGARGLMQLMPGTGARFGVRRPFDPAENIMGGTRYLKQLLEQFGGSVDLVLASYNAGEGAVMKYGGRVPPYRETRDYVKRISKRYGQNKAPAPINDATNTVARASRLR